MHMSRLSCVHFFPDRVILNARQPLVRSFRSGHIDFQSGTSAWEVFTFNRIFQLTDFPLLSISRNFLVASGFPAMLQSEK